MSVHLEAAPGAYAPGVLLPGDPQRARYLAERFLVDAVCVNERRAAFGYTGLWKGARASVQATGMGMPSVAIYAHELIHEFGAKRLVRVGTCGALAPDLKLGDVILATAASTDSNMNRAAFGGFDFAPAADFALLRRAWELAQGRGLAVRAGTVVTSDAFYAPVERWGVFARHGVLAAEMETSALYTVAAEAGVQALSILTVSDIVGRESEGMSGEEREKALKEAAELALELAVAA
jgi:purine-nucleoside phosphorylase